MANVYSCAYCGATVTTDHAPTQGTCIRSRGLFGQHSWNKIGTVSYGQTRGAAADEFDDYDDFTASGPDLPGNFVTSLFAIFVVVPFIALWIDVILLLFGFSMPLTGLIVDFIQWILL